MYCISAVRSRNTVDKEYLPHSGNSTLENKQVVDGWDRGVADGIGRATAAIDEEDKLWRQPGAANEARSAPDIKDKGTDEQQ